MKIRLFFYMVLITLIFIPMTQSEPSVQLGIEGDSSKPFVILGSSSSSTSSSATDEFTLELSSSIFQTVMFNMSNAEAETVTLNIRPGIQYVFGGTLE